MKMQALAAAARLEAAGLPGEGHWPDALVQGPACWPLPPGAAASPYDAADITAHLAADITANLAAHLAADVAAHPVAAASAHSAAAPPEAANTPTHIAANIPTHIAADTTACAAAALERRVHRHRVHGQPMGGWLWLCKHNQSGTRPAWHMCH